MDINKIKRYLHKTKIVIYKFLGKFIPYFKKQYIYMALEVLQDKIKNEISSVLKNEFNGGFIIEEINGNYIDSKYENIFLDSASSVRYKTNDYVESSQLCFVMNMKHNINLPIKVSVIYLDDDFEVKFSVHEVGTNVFDDCMKVEKILKDKKHIINNAFKTYKQ
ncbi:hypothetical protein H4K35_06895 [Myroides sp. NP-2]|uniref:hypothetical protein n=1 Tax=Myroides sp. NP-2 TaxID=2759945 RepID=UPI0015FCF426|nr:hypothetical protein [Myroides sp. NP-2]MBB1149862.1 hypothetical protein [Myroides sp. NP-2]